MALKLLAIFLAGGVGCVSRYLLASGVQRWTDSSFPYGTLACNLLGCLLIGFLATLLTGPVQMRDELRLAILVGLLGGFTTFSSFAWESLSLGRDGQWLYVVGNIVISNLLGVAGAWAGHKTSLAIYGP